MGLALATLYALRYRWRMAIPLAWVFVVATVIDLSNAAVMGIREDLFDKATDVSWLILTFYVPALWVSVVLVAWRLWTREESGSHPPIGPRPGQADREHDGGGKQQAVQQLGLGALGGLRHATGVGAGVAAGGDGLQPVEVVLPAAVDGDDAAGAPAPG